MLTGSVAFRIPSMRAAECDALPMFEEPLEESNVLEFEKSGIVLEPGGVL